MERTIKRRRIIWASDAGVPTGFARVTNNLVPQLQKTMDVVVLGVGYNGDPHNYPFKIYPAKTKITEDQWGIARLKRIVDMHKPDLIFVNNDPWNVIRYIEATDVPVIGYMPVDSPNMLNDVALRLNKSALSIFYTDFGLSVARMAGYTGQAITLPHGVDTKFYRPIPQEKAREALSHNPNAFVIGNVNRNQPRKRLDLTISAFARWLKEYDIQNVILHLHCGLRDIGWDLAQLNRYYGIQDHVWFTDVKMTEDIGLDEAVMPYVYNAFDMQISTTMGEGWGLTTMEGMACGIPQVVPEWAALAEWPSGVVKYMPITHTMATPSNTNSIGGIVSEEDVINALNLMYEREDLRREYSELGRKLVSQPKYNWQVIGRFLGEFLEDFLSRGKVDEVAA